MKNRRPLLFFGLFSFLLLLSCLVLSDAESRAYLSPKLIEEMNRRADPEQLPVIVLYRSGKSSILEVTHRINRRASRIREQVKNHIQSRALEMKQYVHSDGIYASIPRKEIVNLMYHPDVCGIYYDEILTIDDREFESSPSHLAETEATYGLDAIEARRVWNEFSIDGKGMVIGVTDSGIDPNHKDLKGKVLMFRDFTVEGKNDPYDDQGHGTHVCGTLVGGASSGKAIGVAPGAKLVVGKVFVRGSNGSSTTRISWLLDGLDWIASLKGEQKPVVVNCSWAGSSAYSVYWDHINKLIENDIFPCFAAGNNGPGSGSIGVPAALPGAFAVGAVDEKKTIGNFSGRGNVEIGEITFTKPDVVAPGVDIYSSKPGDKYQHLNGTSMACPHISAIVALVKQANPALSVREIKKILYNAAKDLGASGPDSTYGRGFVNAFRAVSLAKDPTMKENEVEKMWGGRVDKSLDELFNVTKSEPRNVKIFGFRFGASRNEIEEYDRSLNTARETYIESMRELEELKARGITKIDDAIEYTATRRIKKLNELKKRKKEVEARLATLKWWNFFQRLSLTRELSNISAELEAQDRLLSSLVALSPAAARAAARISTASLAADSIEVTFDPGNGELRMGGVSAHAFYEAAGIDKQIAYQRMKTAFEKFKSKVQAGVPQVELEEAFAELKKWREIFQLKLKENMQ